MPAAADLPKNHAAGDKLLIRNRFFVSPADDRSNRRHRCTMIVHQYPANTVVSQGSAAQIQERGYRMSFIARPGFDPKDKKNMHHHTLIAAALGLALSTGGAFAQSYNAPAGIPADTAPGGLVGSSSYPVLQDAVPGQRALTRGAVRGDLSTGSIERRSGDRSRSAR